MELLLDTSNPLAILIALALVVLVIFASKKTEQTPLLIVTMVIIIGLLIYHSVYLEELPSSANDLISQAYHCLAVDLVLLLVTFISFLWVDDIVAKKKKLKSYDDSLSWFWNKL